MGTLTITTTQAQDARISEAFGKYLMLDHDATGQEIKDYIIQNIRKIVEDYERNKAIAAAVIEVQPVM